MTAENNTGAPFSPIENQVMTALEKVIDPELGLDLVNLGLIYNVEVDPKGSCTVTMTLTTMGCPLTDYLNNDINRAILSVDGIKECKINLTFEPPWNVDMVSRYAKIALGIYG